MKLVLHIGTEKTGTTTLQNWCADNRGALREQGLYYPKTLGSAPHRSLAIAARDPDKPDDGFREKQINSPADHQAFVSALKRAFDEEVAENADVGTWLISSEHLHSRATSVEMVARVRRFLGDWFESVTILVHLRPQVDVAVSLASTASRGGLQVSREWFENVTNAETYFNYDMLVQRWEAVFGSEALEVLPYKRRRSITEHLIETFGLDARGLTEIRVRNEALDWRTMMLVNTLSRASGNEAQAMSTGFGTYINELPCQERLQIGLAMARQIQSKFDASNARLSARRAELAAGDLMPDWERYDVEPNLDLLNSACVFEPQLRYLVGRLKWEINIERANAKLAECARALDRKNVTNAEKLLGVARRNMERVPLNGVTSHRLQEMQRRERFLAKNISHLREP
jgi:hypothetical protein